MGVRFTKRVCVRTFNLTYTPVISIHMCCVGKYLLFYVPHEGLLGEIIIITHLFHLRYVFMYSFIHWDITLNLFEHMFSNLYLFFIYFLSFFIYFLYCSQFKGIENINNCGC